MKKPVRMRILIEGQLQGTNFRLNTQEQAKLLEVSGFVRILSDGRTEVDIQGSTANVEKMLAWCQQKPHSNHIRTLMYRYDDPVEQRSGFLVR
jgi:acylphosphatase